MDRRESQMLFTIASAVRDFTFYRDELIALRNKFGDIVGLASALDCLIDEIGGSINLFVKPFS